MNLNSYRFTLRDLMTWTTSLTDRTIRDYARGTGAELGKVNGSIVEGRQWKRMQYHDDPQKSWEHPGFHTPGMNQGEVEQVLSAYGPRKVRKEMRRRRKAREQAQKQQNTS